MNTVIFILGPTATGKTAFAISMAKLLQTEIISCDSRQFYEEMSIGTAKPSPTQLKEVKHHFINSLHIYQKYTVSDYEKDSLSVISQLLKMKKIPIVVGGSGLFAMALEKGLDEIPEINPEIRTALNQIFQKDGLNPLLERLQKLDAQYYTRVDKKNPRRIIRALEVCLSTGKPFSDYLHKKTSPRNFHALKIAFELPKDELYARINQRCDLMIENGLLDEVRRLMPYREYPATNTIGYTEFFDYFDGKYSLSQALEKFKQHSRNYSKRQMTWFRKDKNIKWFNANNSEAAKIYILDYLKSNEKKC